MLEFTVKVSDYQCFKTLKKTEIKQGFLEVIVLIMSDLSSWSTEGNCIKIGEEPFVFTDYIQPTWLKLRE
jgi:hypothetical protein